MKSILKHAVGYAGASLIQKGVGFAIFMWLAAAMGPQTYAGLGMFMALQTGITSFAAAGVIESLLGELKNHNQAEQRERYFLATMDIFWGLAGIASIATLIASGPIMNLTGASLLDVVSVILMGILSAFYLLQAYLIRLKELHWPSILVSTVPALLALLAGVAFYLAQNTVGSFFFGATLALTLCLPVFSRNYVGWGGPSGNASEARSLAWKMPPFMVVAMLAWLVGYGSTFLINIFFSSDEGARFTFAYTISSILQLLATSLNQVWTPRFFNQVHQVPQAELEQQNDQFYLLQGMIVGLAGAALIVCVPLAIRIAGIEALDHYRHIGFELFCLLSVYALSINWYHAQNYFLAHGKGREFMAAVVVSTLAGVVFWILGAWVFGLFGAYIAFILQAILKGGVTSVWARRMWGTRLLWKGPVVATAILGAGALLGHVVDQIR